MVFRLLRGHLVLKFNWQCHTGRMRVRAARGHLHFGVGQNGASRGQGMKRGRTAAPLPPLQTTPMYHAMCNIINGPLSQANRAAACISFGKNVSAKSVHLTSLYTALTSTNNDFAILRHYFCT